MQFLFLFFQQVPVQSLHEKIAENDNLIKNRKSSDILADSIETAPKVSQILRRTIQKIRVGESTKTIGKRIDAALKKENLVPSMLGYNNYPATAALSVSPSFMHSPPSETKVHEGSLLTLQISGSSKISHASQGWTVGIGKVSPEKMALQKACVNAMKAALTKIRAGILTSQISEAIQNSINRNEFFPIEDFSGYAMGRERIQPPQILSYASPYERPTKVAEGSILNVRVMVKTGPAPLKIDMDDGWSVMTTKGEFAAMASMMVLVEKFGARSLTFMPDLSR